jgi:hypothetical protein
MQLFVVSVVITCVQVLRLVLPQPSHLISHQIYHPLLTLILLYNHNP